MKTKILFILFGILFLITSYAQDASENRHNNLLNRTQGNRKQGTQHPRERRNLRSQTGALPPAPAR